MKPPKIPLIENLDPNPEKAISQKILYFQQKVGSLLYTTIIIRSDAAKAANKLSEFLTNSSKTYLEAVDKAISYLFGTKFYAIEFNNKSKDSEVFICTSDAAFADNRSDRKSTEGYLCKLFSRSIDWKTSKQKTVTTSTTEAELLAISEAGKQLFW